MDLADRVREFAARVKARFAQLEARAVPLGGASGQILAKNSATDLDLAWVDPAPAAGGSAPQTITVAAGETLGGNRAVYVSASDGKAYLADAANSIAQLFCGLTVGAAVPGAQVTIQLDGPMADNGWSWGSAPIFLGSNGLLTQTPPSSGLVAQAGVPLGPTKMRIDPHVVALA